MKKEVEEIPDIVRRPVVLPVQCGSCLFHKRYHVYAKPCVELGTPASAETCRHFIPDPQLLGPNAGKILRVLSSASKPTLLVAIMLTARRVEKHGFVLGERVYLKVLGADYVCNYASAIVSGATRTQVVLAGNEGYVALVFPNELLTVDAWKEKLKTLIAKNHVNDVNGIRKINVQGKDRLIKYEPQLIGKVKAEKKLPKMKKRGTIKIGA